MTGDGAGAGTGAGISIEDRDDNGDDTGSGVKGDRVARLSVVEISSSKTVNPIRVVNSRARGSGKEDMEMETGGKGGGTGGHVYMV